MSRVTQREGNIMKHVMSWQDLDRRSPTWYVFERYKHGATVSTHLQDGIERYKHGATVSMHLQDGIAPGEGPRAPPPYGEVFLISEGQVT